MVDMPLNWHRQRGPRNPWQTRAVERTIDRLDALVHALNEGADRFEDVVNSRARELDKQQGPRREGDQ